MDVAESLQSVGMSRWESRVYKALLELGETKTGPLVKKSEVPQSKIYAVLESLIKKGLASYIVRGQVKYFQASDPERILTSFREKENELKDALARIHVKQAKSQSVEIFEGIKAIKIMLASLISGAEKGEDFYGFSTGETSKNEEVERLYEWWGERKRGVGLKDCLLISENNKKEFEAKIINKVQLSYVRKKTRYSKISFPGDVAIFRNNVILLNYEDTPTAVLIKSENLSQQYKNFFLDVWNACKA